MMIGKGEVSQIADDAYNLAILLYAYEAALPKLVPGQAAGKPYIMSLRFAADEATRLARGLTDWIEGRWCLTEKELETFVVNKTFNILATVDDRGINLGSDGLLKETWAAMLYASGKSAAANAVLSSAKTFDALACELYPVWSRKVGTRQRSESAKLTLK